MHLPLLLFQNDTVKIIKGLLLVKFWDFEASTSNLIYPPACCRTNLGYRADKFYTHLDV